MTQPTSFMHAHSFRKKSVAAAISFMLGGTVLANPQGLQVVSGQATIQATQDLMKITNTPGAILNWQQFNVGAGQTTEFVQHNAASQVFNRVVGGELSQILGTLKSNGQVFLINPAGLLVGQGAQINTAGFLATTLSISDADIQRKHLQFTQTGASSASIVQQGSIKTHSGGSVVLLSPNVQNSGIIHADGQVLLAAGHQVTLVDLRHPNIGLNVQSVAGQGAVNLGEIVGSHIGLFGALVRNTGIVEATSVQLDESGKISFRGTQGATLSSTSQLKAAGGLIDVSAPQGDVIVEGAVLTESKQGQGGRIQISGDRVAILQRSRLSADGTEGGGTILVGGGWRGLDPTVQNAHETVVQETAILSASGLSNGSGGEVVVFSDGRTHMAGQLKAEGGSQSGDGGRIEVSGLRDVSVTGPVSTRAESGQAGTFLLDPANLLVVATLPTPSTPPITPATSVAPGTPPTAYFSTANQEGGLDGNSYITAQTVVDSLVNNGRVVLTTRSSISTVSPAPGPAPGNGNIVVNAPILMPTPAPSAAVVAGVPRLTLEAEGDVFINSPIGIDPTATATYGGFDLILRYANNRSANLNAPLMLGTQGGLTLQVFQGNGSAPLGPAPIGLNVLGGVNAGGDVPLRLPKILTAAPETPLAPANTALAQGEAVVVNITGANVEVQELGTAPAGGPDINLTISQAVPTGAPAVAGRLAVERLKVNTATVSDTSKLLLTPYLPTPTGSAQPAPAPTANLVSLNMSGNSTADFAGSLVLTGTATLQDQSTLNLLGPATGNAVTTTVNNLVMTQASQASVATRNQLVNLTAVDLSNTANIAVAGSTATNNTGTVAIPSLTLKDTSTANFTGSSHVTTGTVNVGSTLNLNSNADAGTLRMGTLELAGTLNLNGSTPNGGAAALTAGTLDVQDLALGGTAIINLNNLANLNLGTATFDPATLTKLPAGTVLSSSGGVLRALPPPPAKDVGATPAVTPAPLPTVNMNGLAAQMGGVTQAQLFNVTGLDGKLELPMNINVRGVGTIRTLDQNFNPFNLGPTPAVLNPPIANFRLGTGVTVNLGIDTVGGTLFMGAIPVAQGVTGADIQGKVKVNTGSLTLSAPGSIAILPNAVDVLSPTSSVSVSGSVTSAGLNGINRVAGSQLTVSGQWDNSAVSTAQLASTNSPLLKGTITAGSSLKILGGVLPAGQLIDLPSGHALAIEGSELSSTVSAQQQSVLMLRRGVGANGEVPVKLNGATLILNGNTLLIVEADATGAASLGLGSDKVTLQSGQQGNVIAVGRRVPSQANDTSPTAYTFNVGSGATFKVNGFAKNSSPNLGLGLFYPQPTPNVPNAPVFNVGGLTPAIVAAAEYSPFFTSGQGTGGPATTILTGFASPTYLLDRQPGEAVNAVFPCGAGVGCVRLGVTTSITGFKGMVDSNQTTAGGLAGTGVTIADTAFNTSAIPAVSRTPTTLNVVNGTVTLASQDIQAGTLVSVSNGATLNLSPPAAGIGTLAGTFTNNGTINFQGNFQLSGALGGTGNYDVAMGSGLTLTSLTNNPLGVTFRNAGTITSSGTLTFGGQLLAQAGTTPSFVNTGALTLSAGAVLQNPVNNQAGATLTVPAGVSLISSIALANAGTANLAGNLQVASFGNVGTLNLQGSLTTGAYNQTASTALTTLVAGSTLTGSVNINGGTLAGRGTIAGNMLLANANFNPGASPGAVTVQGNLTLNAGSFTNIELQSSAGNKGVDYDSIVVTGAAQLGGTLNLIDTSNNGAGGGLVAGTNFDFIDAASITGAFATVSKQTPAAGPYTLADPAVVGTPNGQTLRTQATAPTAAPTVAPSPAPTATPTVAPTATPSAAPTVAPTSAPTAVPTAAPTEPPTAAPTTPPTSAPTVPPTTAPTAAPTLAPTSAPTQAPTVAPSVAPTAAPTEAPTAAPTQAPTVAPTVAPTTAPTSAPTAAPIPEPTATPTSSVTAQSAGVVDQSLNQAFVPTPPAVGNSGQVTGAAANGNVGGPSTRPSAPPNRFRSDPQRTPPTAPTGGGQAGQTQPVNNTQQEEALLSAQEEVLNRPPISRQTNAIELLPRPRNPQRNGAICK